MLIRFANREDYEEVERIAEQVQKMHVEWRPDIYTFEKKIFPYEIFEQFDYLKDIAKDNNIDAIELQVNAENKAAKSMYEKYGFTDKSINMELKLE